MKVALICPSNKLFMPYVALYEKLLQQYEVPYDVINWDRCHIEDDAPFTFKDQKKGHARNVIDYLKFRRFVLQKLEQQSYDKIIVFSIQLAFFLSTVLIKRYKQQFALDIRDDHLLRKVYPFHTLLKHSAATVLSSPYFKEWLPPQFHYVISHNTSVKSIYEIDGMSNLSEQFKFVIANIGAVRDFQIECQLLQALKMSEHFTIAYHGEGISTEHLQRYIKEQNIENCIVTGKYEPVQEDLLYESSDFINVLRYGDSINNQTALPNRLYQAIIHGKPLIAMNGTCLATIIQQYHLGVVLQNFDYVEEQLLQYTQSFDKKEFNEGRISFLSKVIQENEEFEKQIGQFLQSSYR